MKVKLLQTVKAWINPDGKIKGTYLVEISDTHSSNGEKVVVVNGQEVYLVSHYLD